MNLIVRKQSYKNGCYIATFVYGFYDCPKVWVLRRYIDFVLLRNPFGWLFVKAYYTVSPVLVRWFRHTGWFNHVWRSMLDCLVNTLQSKDVEKTRYEDR